MEDNIRRLLYFSGVCRVYFQRWDFLFRTRMEVQSTGHQFTRITASLTLLVCIPEVQDCLKKNLDWKSFQAKNRGSQVSFKFCFNSQMT